MTAVARIAFGISAQQHTAECDQCKQSKQPEEYDQHNQHDVPGIVAFWNRGRCTSRVDEAVEESSGGGNGADVADCCCFVNVDRDGCIEVVVVGTVHIDCVARGERLRDCTVGDRGIGYGRCVGMAVVG